MDLKKKHPCSDPWSKLSSSSEELPNQICQDQQQHQQQRSNSSLSDYDLMILKQLETSPSFTDQIKLLGQGTSESHDKGKAHVWDPNIILSNLSIMQDNIHQLQDLVHSIVGRTAESSSGQPNELLIQQQQLVTTDLTSIIIQLISTAGSLLPLVKHPHFFGNGVNVSTNYNTNNQSNKDMVNKVEDESNIEIDVHEERESKDEDDVDEGEYLPPGSYEILQLEKEEILAPHTHFCVICGKGFKRDANLRMHMRGHGDEYKTAAALAKPHKERSSEPEARFMKVKRYSCPYIGCKRNKEHNKFQPLKTILCVKNHYKRTHCDKSYTCSRCNTKKFSVIADLKTHEKHCGRDRWLCSCGTTFSRKDKLFGHIALFQGHTPAIPLDDHHGNNNNIQVPKQVESFDFNFTSNSSNGSGIDPGACFSPMNSNAFQDFPRTLFDDSDPSLSFLLSGSCWKIGGESSSKDLQ